MTTSATGSVVDEASHGISGLRVVLEDVSQQFDVKLASDTTLDPSGSFTLSYAEGSVVSPEPGKQIRQMRLRVMVGQHIVKEIVQADLTTQPQLAYGPITLKRAEAESWWATLGTGAPARMTAGNAIQWLADNEEGWGRVADLLDKAGTLDVMQLEIEIDKHGDAIDMTTEKPEIVLRFAPNLPLDDTHARNIVPADDRIERMMLGVWATGHDVRIQLPRMAMDQHGMLVIGVAVLGLASLMFLGGVIAIVVGVLVALIVLIGAYVLFRAHRSFRTMFEAPKLADWYNDAGATSGLQQVRVRELKMRSTMVTHAKAVIDRGVQAVLLGSPFEQVYFDTKAHALDERRRGAHAAKGPIHDVSVGVRGPAVGHVQELFNSHWNLADENDKILPLLPAQLPAPVAQPNPGEFIANAQIVRTLDWMFQQDTNGETGVLEAYLRAIHFAERFIYIENQYFNNDRITQALIDALAAKPALVVILLLNVVPDMPLYLGWQQAAVRRIAGSIGDAAAAKQRLGVFSVWTHAPSDADHSKPRLVDNYLHTKTALIDNRWATVGSANLDGASLDFVQYARAALDGDVRNTEANVVVFEGDDEPRVGADAMRRRLWSEHLGFSGPSATELDDAPGKNWLEVWRARADAKLAGLQANLDAVHPARILPWPTIAYEARLGFKEKYASHTAAKSYLQCLFSPDDQPSDVLASQFEILGDKGPTGFEFKYH